MEYKCCEYLLHQIVFDLFEVKPCCETSMNKENLKLIENFNGKDFNIQQYIDNKNKLLDIFRLGKIPSACAGCPIIKEKNWDKEELYIDRIIMANIAKCSCNCIYCVYTYENPKNKKYFNTIKSYDIKPILTTFKNKNLIKEKFMMIVGGGECSEFPKGELEWLIYFTSFFNGRIQLLSSGIKYSDSIAKILEVGKAELIISPDSGTKKTYEKIKRINAYKKVWNNIEKYIKASKNQPESEIKIKYIIIPEINDSLKEIKNFIKNCKEVNCKNIHIDIEHFWFKDNKNNPIPNNIKTLVGFLNKQNDINLSYSAETRDWFNNCF